jgi:hypothetical protein
MRSEKIRSEKQIQSIRQAHDRFEDVCLEAVGSSS